jgi:TRAP-type C4-dicarboxylate transport system substrate-binding protein
MSPALERISLGVLAGAFVLAGCGGDGGDKAGGSPDSGPLVLTLGTHDRYFAQASFADAVERLSRGRMHVRSTERWRGQGPADAVDFERRLVADVRAGTVQLGIVGVRVWDTLGVDSFQALVAPFLVDSLQLQRRALESASAGLALESVARRGVVGIALLPGALRRPFGVTRVFRRPKDFRGAVMGMRPGAVAAATYRALGARGVGWLPAELSSLDGAELDPITISDNTYDVQGRVLSANIVLWPRAQTIIMNRRTFERLPAAQRAILLEAGRRAVAPELARISRDEQAALSVLCAARMVRLVAATPADVAALRRTVEPVYERIARDQLTRRWVSQLTRMKRSAEPQTLRCKGQS